MEGRQGLVWREGREQRQRWEQTRPVGWIMQGHGKEFGFIPGAVGSYGEFGGGERTEVPKRAETDCLPREFSTLNS